MSKPWFWSTRSLVGRAKFHLEAGVYKQKSAWSKTQSNSSIFLNLFRLGAKSLFRVAVLLFALWYAEIMVRDKLNLLPALSENDKSQYIDQLRLYAQLLTAVFSIYFATIGIILSAGYTRLRRDIIQLLTSEQVGSVYAGVLVFSASFCVAATSLPIFGFEPGYFTYIAATILTLASALTLFPLGQRLFNFFDLVPLVGSELLPNIARHIEDASGTKSISLANHHSREVRRLLDQLAYIDDRIKAETGALETNLPALTENYSRLMLHYLQKKQQIDQGSYWFPRRREHPQWFFAGDSATSMALETSSQLRPEEKPDLNWLETELAKRLRGHIELALNEHNYDLALLLLRRLSSRISVYAYNFHFDVGMNEIRGIRDLIEASVSQETPTTKESHKNTLIAISDAWVALGSNLCLETLRRMITFENDLASFFEKDVWTAEAMRDMPSFLQVDTAFIVDRIKFEQEVEGRRLSQPKYIQQLVVQKLLEAYEKILPIVTDFHQERVNEFARSLLKAELPEAATQVVLASLHSYWKLPQWFEELSQLLERYQAYEHYSERQYVLPQIDTSHMSSGFSGARDRAIKLLGSPELVEYIISYKHDVDSPDHFGQIYYALAEECILALEENQLDKLNKVVRTFVALAILAADTRFVDPDLPVNKEFRMHLVSTVQQDLASIMGFSILYGEYHGNPELSEKTLDALFAFVDKAEDKRQYLIRMLHLADSNNFSWSASPRSIIRTKWKMSFEEMVRKDGYSDRLRHYRGREHASKVVNVFINSHSDASHLFFALQVLPIIGSVDFDLNHHITSLSHRLVEKNAEATK